MAHKLTHLSAVELARLVRTLRVLEEASGYLLCGLAATIPSVISIALRDLPAAR
jgi:hypothetical protein